MKHCSSGLILLLSSLLFDFQNLYLVAQFCYRFWLGNSEELDNKPEEKKSKAESKERRVLNIDHSGWTRMLPIRTAVRSNHDAVATVCFQKRIVVDTQGVLPKLARNGRIGFRSDKAEVRGGSLK